MQRPALSAVAELLKPITWFPPMWAFACGVIASGAALDAQWPLMVVGVVLAVLFVATSFVSPAAVMALVVVVLGLAALEFFTQIASRGVGAPMVIGVVACIALPLGAYYMSHLAITMIVAFAFVAGAVTLIGSSDDQSAAFTSLGALMLWSLERRLPIRFLLMWTLSQ